MDRPPIPPSARNTPFSDEVYHQLFEKSLAVQLLIDPESGCILDANPAACAFYNFDREALTRLTITDINTASPAEVVAEMQRARREERNFFRFRHRLATGEVRDVEVYSSPILGGGRTLLHSIVIDVTARVAMEAHIKKTRAVLGHLTAHVDQAATEIMEGETEASHHEHLSQRELDVMLLLGEGLTAQKVAERLYLSYSTVRTYRGRLYKKMGFASDTDLVRYVTKHGLLDR